MRIRFSSARARSGRMGPIFVNFERPFGGTAVRREARIRDPRWPHNFRSPAMAATPLNPVDLYDVRSLLSEEERMVQDTVARFTDERVLPIIDRKSTRLNSSHVSISYAV